MKNKTIQRALFVCCDIEKAPIQILLFSLSDVLYYIAAVLSDCVLRSFMNTRLRPLIAGRNSLSVLFV